MGSVLGTEEGRGGVEPSGRNNGVYSCVGGGGSAALTKTKLPMPDTDELERRFTKVLVSTKKLYMCRKHSL